FLPPVVAGTLGALECVGILEPWRHRGAGAGEDLVMLDVERAQPALLAHGQSHEIADLDQLELADMLMPPGPGAVVHRQLPRHAPPSAFRWSWSSART